VRGVRIDDTVQSDAGKAGIHGKGIGDVRHTVAVGVGQETLSVETEAGCGALATASAATVVATHNTAAVWPTAFAIDANLWLIAGAAGAITAVGAALFPAANGQATRPLDADGQPAASPTTRSAAVGPTVSVNAIGHTTTAVEAHALRRALATACAAPVGAALAVTAVGDATASVEANRPRRAADAT
jgi:hypothetical protein